MPRLVRQVPRYCKHRASGQAVVTLSGQDFYLGPYGTKASKLEYDRLIAEWLASGRRPLVAPGAPRRNAVFRCVRLRTLLPSADRPRAAFRNHPFAEVGCNAPHSCRLDRTMSIAVTTSDVLRPFQAWCFEQTGCPGRDRWQKVPSRGGPPQACHPATSPNEWSQAPVSSHHPTPSCQATFGMPPGSRRTFRSADRRGIGLPTSRTYPWTARRVRTRATRAGVQPKIDPASPRQVL